MDFPQWLQILAGSPLSLVLLYLLINEQKEHAETRRARDQQNQAWLDRYATLADRVSNAVERLDLPGPP
jgi:hypothetical protein